MAQSIFWYDFETTGTDPRRDRPLQVAGVRTDLELNEIDQPLNLYCRLAEDVLPHPAACLVTGIVPETLERQGIVECEFMRQLNVELSRPDTCTVGYNNLRFDDEMVRHSLYRNFFDPYAREWQGNNSRWDLLGLLRAVYAFRPEGLQWPDEQGHFTLRLDRLTVANGIEHAQAHDALADVRATLALARLVKQQQPRLYHYLWQQRQKHQVIRQIRLLEPLLHVSGRFSAERHFMAPVLPLAWHPSNRNALIVCDLGLSPDPLFELDAETLRERLYTRRAELVEGQLPVPLKLVHINRCPVLAPLNVLRPADLERLRLDIATVWRQTRRIVAEVECWRPKLPALYEASSDQFDAACEEPETRLYDGFITAAERNQCNQVVQSSPEQLATRNFKFQDERLPELLFRYRARNFLQSLSAAETQQWRDLCRRWLFTSERSGSLNFEAFFDLVEQHRVQASTAQLSILDAWVRHVSQLRGRLAD